VIVIERMCLLVQICSGQRVLRRWPQWGPARGSRSVWERRRGGYFWSQQVLDRRQEGSEAPGRWCRHCRLIVVKRPRTQEKSPGLRL